jgi:hypothetical protein
MGASGSLWWDAEEEGFAVYHPEASAARVKTLFATGLWLGGFDPGGNLKLAATTYGAANGATDFYAGPLRWGDSVADPVRGTPTAESCSDWDRVWQVRRFEVEDFRADFADDGMVQGDYPHVFAWPGYGNPLFLTYNGFELPATAPQGLAPFFDVDGDGRYDPYQGDYPYVPQSLEQPDLISWAVFHDVGPHLESEHPYVLQMEVQHTAWAYNCAVHPWLNETVFSSFKLTNLAIESIDSLYLGLWTDPDLGCYTDDYVGSAPELATFYAYNEDAVDGLRESCPDAVSRFTGTPAVQAITFLNTELASFTVYERSVPPGQVGASYPETGPAYYHYLSGSFRDGTPLSRGGNGYNPGAPAATRTPFAYPDRPDDSGGWSMFQEDIGVGDRRCVGSTYIARMEPGAARTVDLAYSFHHQPDSSHLQNVNLMYEQVADLQELYTTQFRELCAQVERCTEDCVWAGDANADGVANHYDLLPIMYGRAAAGALRNPPIVWAPQPAEAWGIPLPTHPDVDVKHADCDADGEVGIADFEITRRHLGQERPDYVEPANRYQEGPELVFRPRSDQDDFLNIGPAEVIRCEIALSQEVVGLQGLAFELEYDLDFLAPFEHMFNWPRQDLTVEAEDVFYIDLLEAGQVDLTYYQLTGEVPAGRLHRIPIELRLRDGAAVDGLPNDTTYIRFRNIVAYDQDGNPLDIGGQTTPVTISEDIMVSAAEPVSASQLQLFPNPVRDHLQLRWPNIELESYQVFDLNGKLLLAGQGAGQQLGVDVSQLAAGVYIIRLQASGKGTQCRRFVRW